MRKITLEEKTMKKRKKKGRDKMHEGRGLSGEDKKV